MCFSAIHWAGIRRIVFGASIADAQACGFSELAISNREMAALGKSKIKISQGVLRSECASLFREFSSKNRGKKLY
jgi:tRNA(Arg) A34 adenosine deaminase TadA